MCVCAKEQREGRDMKDSWPQSSAREGGKKSEGPAHTHAAHVVSATILVFGLLSVSSQQEDERVSAQHVS